MFTDMYKSYLSNVVIAKFSTDKAHREEALLEILELTNQSGDKIALQNLTKNIPALRPELYSKWAHMFAERILETVPMEQVEELCRPSFANKATIALLFAMFMESERMENQIANDLEELELLDTKGTTV